ncbi:MAG: hypothetical protein IT291_02080 [Deltaproteobacteria bacterium]|nr:hypothetical protein [Deltaproteobacteria bacterium]
MNDDRISQVFGNLQELEKRVEHCKKILSRKRKYEPNLTLMLRQQEQILVKMRRTANKLQLENASEDWQNFYRSLNVFNGLRAIVQPEILQTFSELSINKAEVRA